MGKYLLLGSGFTKENRFDNNWEGEVTTLDVNPDCSPDVVWDLNNVPLPFEDGSFDEIHAYEILEHVGRQGDVEFFFKQFNDFYRILKPGGKIKATVPWWQHEWAVGDPGHTRVFPPALLVFLDRVQYDEQLGKTAMSDYRKLSQCDFKCDSITTNKVSMAFVLIKR